MFKTRAAVFYRGLKSIPTPWKAIGNSQGEGVLTVKILVAKNEAKVEFPGGTWVGGGGV